MERKTVLLRTPIIGFIYFLATMLTAIVGKFLGLFAESGDFNFLELLILLFVGGCLIGVVMLPIQTPVKRWQRLLVNFFVIYMLSYFLGALEIAIYTDYASKYQLFLLLDQLIVSLTVAIAITLLFNQTSDSNVFEKIRQYFSKRSKRDWFLRFSIATILFPPIYLFFGFLFTPVTSKYYFDSFLSLKIPPLEVILAVELLRGFFYALTFTPLLATLKMDLFRLGLYFSILLAVLGAIVPLMVSITWPLELRVGHCIEMTLDSFAQGFLIAYLLSDN